MNLAEKGQPHCKDGTTTQHDLYFNISLQIIRGFSKNNREEVLFFVVIHIIILYIFALALEVIFRETVMTKKKIKSMST